MQGLILLAIALAIALIASTNVASLQLVRAEVRRRETATRLALGGARGRLLRQWMTEGFLLAVFGCSLAIVVGLWIVHVLPSLFTAALPGAGYDFRLDSRALVFTVAVSITATLVFGFAPAVHAWNPDLASMLKTEAVGSPAVRGMRLRDALVVTQVAMSIVLLMAAGLLVRTLDRLQAVDPGFNPHQNILMLNVVPELAYRDDVRLHHYYRAVQERLGALPGVEQVSVVQRVPFSPSLGGAEKQIAVPGLQPPSGRSGFPVNFDVVGPGYFALMQTKLLRGRAFDAGDGPEGMKVAIVNETMARRFWSGRDAAGQHFQISKTDYVVVGVVEDTKWENLAETARPLLYFPTTQQRSDSLTILVRTRNDVAAITSAVRAELRRIDSSVPLLSAMTLKQHMDFTLNNERVRARLTSAFAGLGLLLVGTGLYGVLSFIVTRRSREIGIRVALGAGRRDILRLVFDYGVRRVVAGAAIGSVLALISRRLIAGLLFGVTPSDPATIAAVGVVLLAAGAAATLVPALRATRVDPTVALRFD
jgi:predicted permease